MTSPSNPATVAATVWGPGACFTRPELRTERVTYPVITFPAAVGVLDAIFRKPEFVWKVQSIAVHKQGTYTSIMRNEISAVATDAAHPIVVDNATRDQRGMLYLRDVAYTIRAVPMVKSEHRQQNSPLKFRDMFLRRVRRGQCLTQPYLGTREFSAFFSEPDPQQQRVPWTQDLGVMHSGFTYTQEGPTPNFATFEIVNGEMSMR